MDIVTLVMEMSSDQMLSTVVAALREMPGVSLGDPGWTGSRRLVVAVDASDPDTVDIVREIIWELDALATQHAVHLGSVA